jgi:hypothetical protein
METKFQEDRIDKWVRRIIAIICFLVWTYLCLHIGAFIERQSTEINQNIDKTSVFDGQTPPEKKRFFNEKIG